LNFRYKENCDRKWIGFEVMGLLIGFEKKYQRPTIQNWTCSFFTLMVPRCFFLHSCIFLPALLYSCKFTKLTWKFQKIPKSAQTAPPSLFSTLSWTRLRASNDDVIPFLYTCFWCITKRHKNKKRRGEKKFIPRVVYN